jgi:hypothetical protein
MDLDTDTMTASPQWKHRGDAFLGMVAAKTRDDDRSRCAS